MSLWTSIRGPLELAAGAVGAAFLPEVLPALGLSSAGGAAAGTFESLAGGDAGGSLLSGALDVGKTLLPAIGALGAGGLAYSGQQQTNAANAQQALQQEQFQAEMSNTAYQRATKDMEAAGLNPMLAYTQGGASSPSGAQAVMGNAAGAGANSALSGAATMAQLENALVTNDKIQADTRNVDSQTALNRATLPRVAAQTGESAASAEQLRQATENLRYQTDITANKSYISNQMQGSGKALEQAQAQAEYDILRAKLAGLGVNEASAESEFWGSKFGKAQPYIQRGLQDANSALSIFKPWGAGGVSGGLRVPPSRSSLADRQVDLNTTY